MVLWKFDGELGAVLSGPDAAWDSGPAHPRGLIAAKKTSDSQVEVA